MANFAKVLKTNISILKYKTATCPLKMEESITPFIERDWKRYSEITKSKFGGFTITLGKRTTYGIRKFSFHEDGHIEYLGFDSAHSNIRKTNTKIISIIEKYGLSKQDAKALVKELNAF